MKQNGLLKGKRHSEGGINAIVDGSKTIELEGGETIINRKSSKLFCKELSEINQAGGGVPIPCDSSGSKDEFGDGGKIADFEMPDLEVLRYGQKLKKDHPKIWKSGGNIRGNESFQRLLEISQRGYWLKSEKEFYKRWQSFKARHQHNHNLAGVVANIKWASWGNIGKEAAKEVVEGNNKYEKGGIIEAKSYRLPRELNKKTTTGDTGFGGQREVVKGNIASSDLILMENNLALARNAIAQNPKLKISKKPLTVGVDIISGKKQLLDGYHRYVSAGERGTFKAYFIPMYNGIIISFAEIKDVIQGDNKYEEGGMIEGENESMDIAKKYGMVGIIEEAQKHVHPMTKDDMDYLLDAVEDNQEEEFEREAVLKYEEGGVIPSGADAAKEFMENISLEEKQSLINKFIEIKSNYIIEIQNSLDEAKKRLEENEQERKNAVDIGVKTNLSDKSYRIKREIRYWNNYLSVVKNDSDAVSFTDKRGLEHKKIPKFSGINTSNIQFDEDTILVDELPAYIPQIDEDKFRSNGYVFDAIRIAKDEYILAVNGYKERVSEKAYMDLQQGETIHPNDMQQGYVLVTLDQLVLISEYYYVKAKAVLKKEAERANERQEEMYDRLPRERREKFLSQKNFYNSIPANLKKKITQIEYEALSFEEKEKIYKPFKRYGAKRIVSKLSENTMWRSFHEMYERFLNPEALPMDRQQRPIPITGARVGIYGNREVFDYWYLFVDMMKWKFNDIKVQREVDSETRKIALETSFGESNTSDVLKEEYGILVKRQNGSTINPVEIDLIKESWTSVQSLFGGLSSMASDDNLKISHTGEKLVYASKAVGVYIPEMKTIAVSNKFGPDFFASVMSHEVAHYIDNKIGAQNGRRYASDNYEEGAGMIGKIFRSLMNQESKNDYINATKECFARAMEQYFSVEKYGPQAATGNNVRYFDSNEYVSELAYNEKIKPLIQSFLEDNKDFFKYRVEVKDDFNQTEELIIENQKEDETDTIGDASGQTENSDSTMNIQDTEEKTENLLPNFDNAIVKDWSLIPTNWKVPSMVKPVKISERSWKDDTFMSVMLKFASDDELRLHMNGVFFDKRNGYAAATNGHILAKIKTTHLDDGIHGDKKRFSKPITGVTFPNYMSVFPDFYPHIYEVDLLKLKTYCECVLNGKYCNEVHKQVSFKANDVFAFNIELLLECIKGFMYLGFLNIHMGYTAPNKGVMFSSTKDGLLDTKNDDVSILIMPVMVLQKHKVYDQSVNPGAYNFDYENYLQCYFSFEDNEIHNYDGSIATFDKSLEEKFEGLSEIQYDSLKVITNKPPVPICENIYVKNQTCVAHNLSSYLSLKGIKIADGLYSLLNGSLRNETDRGDRMEDFPLPKNEDSKVLIAKMNANSFNVQIKNANIAVGTDPYKEALNSVSLNTEEKYIASTNGYMLYYNELEAQVSQKNTISLKHTNLYEKVSVLFENMNIMLFSGSDSYTIEAEGIVFGSRIEHDAFPRFQQLLSDGNKYKNLTISKQDLSKCGKFKFDDGVGFFEDRIDKVTFDYVRSENEAVYEKMCNYSIKISEPKELPFKKVGYYLMPIFEKTSIITLKYGFLMSLFKAFQAKDLQVFINTDSGRTVGVWIPLEENTPRVIEKPVVQKTMEIPSFAMGKEQAKKEAKEHEKTFEKIEKGEIKTALDLGQSIAQEHSLQELEDMLESAKLSLKYASEEEKEDMENEIESIKLSIKYL